jgi:membrane protein DedA with SNARE-associated domain
MPFAGTQFVGARDNWWGIFLAGTCGAVGSTLGSVAAYWVGASIIRPLLERQREYPLVSQHQLRVADRWFGKFGAAAVFVARLVPVLRTFIALPAGIMRMDLRKFIIYTFLGSFLWSAGLAWAGTIWEPVEVREAIRPFDIPIFLIILALLAWLVVRRRRNRNEQAPATRS